MAKYYYNGALLPEIPADVLAEYPHIFFYKWTESGAIDFMAAPSTYRWYYYNDESYTQLRIVSCTYVRYKYDIDSKQWVYYKSYTDNGQWGIGDSGDIVWANHDIRKGSEAGAKIYYYASEPVPYPDLVFEDYTIKRESLVAIGDAIRGKTGGTDSLTLEQMVTEIEGMATGSAVTSDALVDIRMTGGANYGVNLGTGGSAYDATNTNGSFAEGKWYCSGAGSLAIPSDFLCGTDPWTIAFTIKDYTTSSANYSRIAQGYTDVPSLYWSNANDQFQIKLAAATIASDTAGATILDEEFMSYDSNATVSGFYYPTEFTATYVFRNNGKYISFWVNGFEKVRELSSNYLEAKYSDVFGIGDVLANKGYNMTYLECSMLKAWNRALTDEEVIMVSCGR